MQQKRNLEFANDMLQCIDHDDQPNTYFDCNSLQ